MSAYAVKHIEKEQGPLVHILKDIKKKPFSFTSKKSEAMDAATGKFVYVIEVLRDKGITSYRLGYKYKCLECDTKPGSALWKGTFKFKNSAKHGEIPECKYFDEPILITDVKFIDWFKEERLGMARIPNECIKILESIFVTESTKVREIKI